MQFNGDIEACIQVLTSGGLFLYPTDTIWGIGCDPTNEVAVRRVYALKQRVEEKSLIILVNSEAMLKTFALQPPPALLEAMRSQRTPATGIFAAGSLLAKNLIHTDGTVAIRIAKDLFCRQLIEKWGKPIVSTSANVSGEPFDGSFGDISSHIKNGVDYIVQHRQNELIVAQPSRILRLRNGEVEFLR